MDIWEYAKRGRLDGVKRLIQQGTDVNSINQYGQSALFVACQHGHYAVAEFLLASGARVNFRAKPLIAAARYGQADCVELLLKHGADACGTNLKGESALSVAVDRMNISVILLLLDHGVRSHFRLDDTLIQMFIRVRGEHAATFRRLLIRGLLSINSNDTLLAVAHFAFKRASLVLASELWHQVSISNIEEMYPMALYYSVRNNWRKILTELLRMNTDVNVMTESRTPLYVACEQGAEYSVALLLQHGAGPNLLCCRSIKKRLRAQESSRERQTALHVACSNDETQTEDLCVRSMQPTSSFINERIVGLLLKHGANVNAVSDKGETALYHACRSRQVNVVQLLLDAGADANLKASQTYPLIIASTSECKGSGWEDWCMESMQPTDSDINERIVGLLLKHGANVNAVSDKGETALYHACRNQQVKVVQLLLDAGADANLKASQTYPLIIACNSECKGSGSNANAMKLRKGVDERGNARLIKQSSGDAASIVKLLVNNGAEVNSKDEFGKTALRTATSSGLTDVVCLLLEAGAHVAAFRSTGVDVCHSVYIACEMDFPEILDLLLQYSHMSNKAVTMSSLLSIATRNCYADIVEVLLKHGADVKSLTVFQHCTRPAVVGGLR